MTTENDSESSTGYLQDINLDTKTNIEPSALGAPDIALGPTSDIDASDNHANIGLRDSVLRMLSGTADFYENDADGEYSATVSVNEEEVISMSGSAVSSFLYIESDEETVKRFLYNLVTKADIFVVVAW